MRCSSPMYGPSFIASHLSDLSHASPQISSIASIDLYNLVPAPIDNIDSSNYPKNPTSPIRQQRPVYGTGNPCGCPLCASAHPASAHPEYFQQTTLSINGIHLGVDYYAWQQSPTSGTLVLLHGFTGST